MRRADRGLSLIEALFSLALAGLVFGIVVDLYAGYSRVVTHSSQVDAVIEGAQVAIQTVAGELAGAQDVLDPAEGGASSTLVFTRIDPGEASRFAPSSPWEPAAPACLARVEWYVAEGSLRRRVQAADGTVHDLQVQEGVSGFSARRPPPSEGSPPEVICRISYLRQRTVHVLEQRVGLRVGQ